MVGIYKIISPTGRIYVGQSVDLQNRFKKYLKLQNCKNQKILYNSFLKHGVENHILEIIEECELKQLNIRERFWQDHYNVLNGGLNCLLTKTCDFPQITSEYTKKKISKSLSGESNPMFGKKGKDNHNFGKVGELSHNFGRKHSIETSNKKSIIFKGINNPFYGKTHTKKTLEKLSKCVFDIKTGKVYNTIKEAANVYNIHYKTLTCWLNGSRKNKTSLIYC